MLQFCKVFWGHAPRPHSGIDQGPVPARRNNSIPGINVPCFRDSSIPRFNSVPERRNNAIKGINLG